MTPLVERGLGIEWPDWAIYCTMGNFSRPVATIILPKFDDYLLVTLSRYNKLDLAVTKNYKKYGKMYSEDS